MDGLKFYQAKKIDERIDKLKLVADSSNIEIGVKNSGKEVVFTDWDLFSDRSVFKDFIKAELEKARKEFDAL